MNYHNEFDPKAAAWLREMIRLGELPPGVVDERSIKDVQPDDLHGFTQCHFFAGIGGWPLALRMAGWPDDRPIWTGSCPCQPFSVAGKGAGVDDARHLWPDLLRLVSACRPPVVMGEQVAGAAGYGWLDGVLADLAGEGYSGRGVDIPACAVDAPHIRQRLYWIAVADAGGCGPGGRAEQPGWHERDGAAAGRDQGAGRAAECDEGVGHAARGGGESAGQPDPPGRAARGGEHRGSDHVGGNGVDLVDASGLGRRERRAQSELRSGRSAVAGAGVRGGVPLGDSGGTGLALGSVAGFECGDVRQKGPTAAAADSGNDGRGGFWSRHDWIACHDGKARRIPEPGFPLLADGVPNRVAKWRGFGNAIVPPLTAEVIAAFLDAEAGAC